MSSLSTDLHLAAQQKLALTPQLKEALQVLQMSTQDLAEAVAEKAAANPLIETDADGFDPTFDHGEAPAPAADPVPFDRPVGVESNFERSEALITWSQTARRTENEDESPEAGELVAREETLAEHLLKQLGCSAADPELKACAEWLVGCLDDNGFLADPLEDCAASAPFAADDAVWRAALRLLQSFDPAGVAALNLTESLLLQIKARTDLADDVRQTAEALLAAGPERLVKLTTAKAARTFKQPESVVAAAISAVRKLTPRPAADFADPRQSAAVIPDVILYRTEAGLEVRLNPQVVPALRFNDEYFQLLTKAKLSGDEAVQWKTRSQDAKTFIRALEQRFSTVTAVAQTIVDAQHAFFTEGLTALRPMVLRDVAQRLNLSESTVSRATVGKYLQTDRGTFELKFFFTSALTGGTAGAVSALTARRRIRELIDAEDPKAPLSDEAIARQLTAEGIEIARRTVAKYREAENIAPKSLRRRMKVLQ